MTARRVLFRVRQLSRTAIKPADIHIVRNDKGALAVLSNTLDPVPKSFNRIRNQKSCDDNCGELRE